MDKVIYIFIGFIVMEHFLFLYLEMFLWTSKKGRKIFAMSNDDAQTTKVLAGNQGLYNGFLAVGLLWGVWYPNIQASRDIILFFLTCILIAGIYGGFTAKKSTLYVQALPALCTMLLMVIL